MRKVFNVTAKNPGFLKSGGIFCYGFNTNFKLLNYKFMINPHFG